MSSSVFSPLRAVSCPGNPRMFEMMKDVAPEIISRSVCLFHEYHGLHEDDYEGIFYWDPETGLFGLYTWTTAAACGLCPDISKFAYRPCDVYAGKIPEDYKERILEGLRERLTRQKKSAAETLRDNYERYYNRYSYQKEAFVKFIAEAEEKFESVVRGIDSIAFLLYYTPECTSGSYKNDKDSLEFSLKDGDIIERLAKVCENQPVSRRKKAQKLEGTRFEGEVISIRTEFSTYGLRSDWKNITKVGARMEDGRSFWFNAPKGYKPVKGEKVVVWSKYVQEFEKSFTVRRPVIETAV